MKSKSEWTTKRARIAVTLTTLVLCFSSGSSVAEQGSVTKIASLGAISAGPVDYGVYQDDLYYSIGDRLFRMTGSTNTVTEVPLPEGLGAGVDLDAEFAAFDGALMFHASRAFTNPERRGRFLHRLVRDGERYDITLIDVPEEPDTAEYSWVFERGYADNSTHFALHENQLYFFANQAAPGASFDFLTRALYRLKSANAIPQKIDWNSERIKIETYDLKATQAGPVLDYKIIAEPLDGVDNLAVYTIIREPVPADTLSQNPVARPFSVAVPGLDPQSVFFDGHVYFATINYDIDRQSSDSVGPLPDPYDNVVTTADTPYQVELGRINAATGERTYFDLVRTRDPDTTGNNGNGGGNGGNSGGVAIVGIPTVANTPLAAIESIPEDSQTPRPRSSHRDQTNSFPANFFATGDTLYFNAADPHVVSHLYALDTEDVAPVAITVGSLYRQTAIASINGQFWFSGKYNNIVGVDLHRKDPGTGTYTPTLLGRKVAKTARSFTAFGKATVFTARDDNRDWGIYLYDPSQDSVPAGVNAKLTINDGIYSAPPGQVLEVKSNLSAICSITNDTPDALENLIIKIKEIKKSSRLRVTNQCEQSRLEPGATTRCMLFTKAKGNLRKYVCKARTPAGLLARDQTWVTGIRN